MIKDTEDNKRLAAEKEVEVREALNLLNSKLEVIGNLVHDTVPIHDDEVMTWHITCALTRSLYKAYFDLDVSIRCRPIMLWLDHGVRNGWSQNSKIMSSLWSFSVLLT